MNEVLEITNITNEVIFFPKKDSKYELFLSISKFKPLTFLKINTAYIEPL